MFSEKMEDVRKKTLYFHSIWLVWWYVKFYNVEGEFYLHSNTSILRGLARFPLKHICYKNINFFSDKKVICTKFPWMLIPEKKHGKWNHVFLTGCITFLCNRWKQESDEINQSIELGCSNIVLGEKRVFFIPRFGSWRYGKGNPWGSVVLRQRVR